jgi:hypothetical protein
MLAARPQEVSNYGREGNNLILTMRDGHMIRIKGFFAHGVAFNHLVFVDGDQAWVANFSQALAPAGDGLDDALVTYAAHDEAAKDGLLPILGALAVGAVGISASRSSSGGTGYSGTPDAPGIGGVKQNPTGSLTVSGTGRPGDIITVTYPDGSTATGTVDGHGNYAITSPGVVAVGPGAGSVSVVDTDPGTGHSSPPAQGHFTDTTPPQALGVGQIPPNGDGTITVTGKAEPGSKVTVTFPDGSTGTATAGDDGSYSVSSKKPQTSGDVSAIATDPAGNTSGRSEERRAGKERPRSCRARWSPHH